MINISVWMEAFCEKLKETFGSRVWFIGLQGSYSRGEATQHSDIDVVVILNELNCEDIKAYNEMLNKLPHRELICGFLSGKADLLHWDPSDLFQFYHDTKPIVGTLDALLPLIDKAAVCRTVKVGACNIFHGCVHNMLHEKDQDILKGLYKSATFVIQAIHYLESGKYISKLTDILPALPPREGKIIATYLDLKQNKGAGFAEMSETLFEWCQYWIGKIP